MDALGHSLINLYTEVQQEEYASGKTAALDILLGVNQSTATATEISGLDPQQLLVQLPRDSKHGYVVVMAATIHIPLNRTTDNVFIMQALIANARKAKKKLYCCFVDFKKAFDSVGGPCITWCRGGHPGMHPIMSMNRMRHVC